MSAVNVVGACRIYIGDCRDVLHTLPKSSVHCVVTSPPYWRKRDYGVDGQMGIEGSPDEFIDAMVPVFSRLRSVVVPGGCCWVNIGDTYASCGNGGGGTLSKKRAAWRAAAGSRGGRSRPLGWKDKDLVLIAAFVTEAIRNVGWHLRQTVIWAKPRAIEPPRVDRPATSHEWLAMFSNGADCRARDPGESWWRASVWPIAEQNASVGHPAMMPTEIARRCIVCSTRPGEVILDPFGGSGTTGLVAERLQRQSILIELSPDYADLAARRIASDAPLIVAGV